MKAIVIGPLRPPTDIYGSTDPDNLELLVSGFTGTEFTVTGITDITIDYTVRVVGNDCESITKTLTFTITPTPTVTASVTPTPTPTLLEQITWSPYVPYCIQTATCPSGYSLSPDGRVCSGVRYEPATQNGETIYVNNRTHTTYSIWGAKLYEVDGYDTNGESLPGYSFTALSATPLWGNPGFTTTDGRLNATGVWGVTGDCMDENWLPLQNEWIGFSHKIVIEETKTYYVGLAGDNRVKFLVDGHTVVEQQGADQQNFHYWHIYPVVLQKGTHFIEIMGLDTGSPASFGGEIYDATAAQIIAATTEFNLNIIFSTKNLFCEPLYISSTNGYSCPAGWSLDTTDPDNIRCAYIEEIESSSLNTGYLAYRYRKRLVNGVWDSWVEENLPDAGLGTYFPPVLDTAACPVGSFVPESPTPTASVTPTVTPSLTPTLTPSPTPVYGAYYCNIAQVDATAQFVGGNLINGDSGLEVRIVGMGGGYFGLNNIDYAFFISSATCRPCQLYTGSVWFTNQTTGDIEIMNIEAGNLSIKFEGYLDPDYLWDAEFTIPMNCEDGMGGCILKGTKVTLADGSLKNIEDLHSGDLLMSLQIEGLVPFGGTDDQWTPDEFRAAPGIAVVQGVDHFSATKIYRINGVLSSTKDHKHLIYQNDKYLFERAENIREGDFLLNEYGELVYINTVEIVEGLFDTYNIDVEELDVYFVNGLLTHNKELPIE